MKIYGEQSMQTRTATSKVTQLVLLGCAAAVASCATQPDEQPAQFNSPPIIEAIYARDSATAAAGLTALPDVQVWANASDPHYPSQTGETGAQNAAAVSRFPASYGSLVIEFNIPLDGSKFGVQNDLGSYCTTGLDPATAPFKLVDVDASNRVLIGSICYDPTSPLDRYPSLTFVVGAGVSTDASAQPFTCNSFNPSAYENDSLTALVPQHHYAVQFNTADILSQNGQALTTPSDAAFASGTFSFQASGFDIMAAGYQDQNSGYYTFIDKPYAGFLKDLAAAGSGYVQPSDDTPFFVITTYAYNADGNCLPASADDSATVTATRANDSDFQALVFDDFCFLGVISSDPRIIYVTPALAIPGFDGAVNGGSGVWEPGQSYKVKIPGTLADILASGTTLGTDKEYDFKASPGDPAPTQISPLNGAVAQLVYARNGPSTAAHYYAGVPFLAANVPSWITVNFNVPIDQATAMDPANFKVAGPDGMAVAGHLITPTATNNMALAFQPTAVLNSSTVYTVTVSGLKADATVPGFTSGPTIPTLTSVFTTSSERSSGFSRLCTAGPVPGHGADTCLGAARAVSADRGANQPLQILKDGVTAITYTRISANVSNSTVQIIEGDGSGTPIDASQVTVSPSTSNPFLYRLKTSAAYPIKCNTHYVVRSEGKGSPAATPITDTDEATPQQLSYEGCKAGDCSDLRTFTTEAFGLQALDTSGNKILFTASGDKLPLENQTGPGATATADTVSIQFNATPDHAAVNALITNNQFIKVTDSAGATVNITCPLLPNDDSGYEIDCTTTTPLAQNATYFASLVVSTPIPIAAQTTLTPRLVTHSLGTTKTPTGKFIGDQTSCTFTGSISASFTTPCPQSTPRVPHARTVTNKLASR
jgi:hypothetical protein